MLIFKDKISGDELCSDTYPCEVFEEVLYKIKGKYTSEATALDPSLFGANASEDGQGEGEGAEDGAKMGVDIVFANRLMAVPFTKKDYTKYIKGYLKNLKTKLEADGADVKAFMAGAQAVIPKILKDFDEYEFFIGESMNPDGMTVLLRWDEETPYMYFFKDGLIEEKV